MEPDQEPEPAPEQPGDLGVLVYPDETLIGFIFRLAKRRLMTGRAVAKECGFERLTNRPRPQWLRALATSARVELPELEAISFGYPDDRFGWYRGVRLPGRVFDISRAGARRMCPECLVDSPHYRAAWDLLFISICPVHSKRLIDHCRDCGKPLRWIGGDLTICGCETGGEVAYFAAQPIDERDTFGTKVVLGLLGDAAFQREAEHARRLPPFVDLEPGAIVDFLFRLGLELLGPRRKMFSLEDTGAHSWDSHVALNRAVEAAEMWPETFYEVLDRIRRRWNTSPSIANWKTFDVVARWLNALPEGHGTVIRESLARYREVARAEMRARDPDFA